MSSLHELDGKDGDPISQATYVTHIDCNIIFHIHFKIAIWRLVISEIYDIELTSGHWPNAFCEQICAANGQNSRQSMSHYNKSISPSHLTDGSFHKNNKITLYQIMNYENLTV